MNVKEIKDHILKGRIIKANDRYYRLINNKLYYTDYSINNQWNESKNDIKILLEYKSIELI